MARSSRMAAWLVVFVTALASPLPAAARSRAAGAKTKKPHAASPAARSQAPLRRAAPAEVGAGQREERPQGEPGLNTIVRWEGPDGAVHYAPRYEVPPSSQPKIRRVYTSVGVVPLDRAEPETPPPSPPRAGATSAAAFPAITLPPGPAPPAIDASRAPAAPPQGATPGPMQPAAGGAGR